MGRSTRFVAVVPIVAGLAWLSAYAVEVGAVGTTVYDASREMTTWTAPAPSVGTWNSVDEDLVGAQVQAPSNPTVQELLGVLDTRRVERPEYLAEAGVHFVRALEFRPTSPYTWASLAAVKYRQGDTGRDFESALVRAAGLGPFEPEVQRRVAYFGLAVWNEVAPETRAAIEAMVANGMRRNPMETLQIAERRGRLDVACRHLVGSPRLTDSKWSQICQSVEATP
jgi:hypothetical protein